jgi:Domain of unknown function (DUF929)
MSRSISTPSTRRPTARSGATIIAWSSVGLVLVVVAALVIFKVTAGPGPTTSSHQAVVPASLQLVHEVSSVPASVFNRVGVAIPSTFAGTAPIVISGQPPLTLTGKTPSVMYYGAEYCPYCAAERWAMVVALARFGTWHGLSTTASGLLDGDYSTFSFRRATLDSRYVHFAPIEACTNEVDPKAANCSGYGVLQTPSRAEQKVLTTYAAPRFVPDDTGGIAFPYVDVDNRVLFSGSTYQPTVLTGLSQSEIAGTLTDPTNPVTESIVGTANYITAAVCSGTGGIPRSVCTGPGVAAATKAMKLG